MAIPPPAPVRSHRPKPWVKVSQRCTSGTLRLLTLDGGAAAAIQARVIRQLERDRPGFLAEVDLLAGSSDGCLVSFFLATHLATYPSFDGMDVAEVELQRALVDRTNARVVDRCVEFVDQTAAALRPSLRDWAAFTLGLRSLKDGRRLHAVYREHFKELTLGDVHEKLIIGIAMDLSANRPRTFRNFGWETERPELSALVLGEKLADIARYSSAVPILLPLKWSKGFPEELEPHLYADGSLVANNPTMTALTNAISYLAGEGEEGGVPLSPPTPAKFEHLSHVAVVSLGACEEPRLSGEGEVNQGWPGWLLGGKINLASLALNGWLLPGNTEVHNQARHLLGDHRYFRVCPDVPLKGILAQLFFGSAQGVARLCQQAADAYTRSEEYRRLLDWMDVQPWGRPRPLGPSR